MNNPFYWAVRAVAVLALIGSCVSFIAQYVMGMNPCVMCIQQRLALLATLILSLPLLFNIYRKMWVRWGATLLLSAPMVFGWWTAVEQIYIQSLPLAEQPSCGAPWTFRLRDAFLFDWYEPIIRGTGACGEMYYLWGVSLTIWSVCFFSLMLFTLWGGLIFSYKKR